MLKCLLNWFQLDWCDWRYLWNICFLLLVYGLPLIKHFRYFAKEIATVIGVIMYFRIYLKSFVYGNNVQKTVYTWFLHFKKVTTSDRFKGKRQLSNYVAQPTSPNAVVTSPDVLVLKMHKIPTQKHQIH